jgi:hypothetical protein
MPDGLIVRILRNAVPVARTPAGRPSAYVPAAYNAEKAVAVLKNHYSDGWGVCRRRFGVPAGWGTSEDRNERRIFNEYNNAYKRWGFHVKTGKPFAMHTRPSMANDVSSDDEASADTDEASSSMPISSVRKSERKRGAPGADMPHKALKVAHDDE